MSNCVITQEEVFVERCFTMTQDTIDSFILHQMEKDVSDSVRGVIWNKRTQKWRAILVFKKKSHYLGEYYGL